MGKLLTVISLRDRSGRCMYEEHNLAVSNLGQYGEADQMVFVSFWYPETQHCILSLNYMDLVMSNYRFVG